MGVPSTGRFCRGAAPGSIAGPDHPAFLLDSRISVVSLRQLVCSTMFPFRKKKRREEASVDRDALLGRDAQPLPALPHETLMAIQDGAMKYTYKGVVTHKCPFDLALYSQLIWELKPGAILEVGSRFGGSALWFADQLRCAGLDSPVLSVDIKVPEGVSDPLVEFLHGDAHDLGKTLTAERLAALPKPWFVVEDSSHLFETTLAVLRFFHEFLAKGDRVIIEDGILESFGWGDKYDGGPRPALHQFLSEHPSEYAIDRAYCDFYGTNMTWNPDGYLVRIA